MRTAIIRYAAQAVGLKPSAMECEARLRGLKRIISLKTIIFRKYRNMRCELVAAPLPLCPSPCYDGFTLTRSPCRLGIESGATASGVCAAPIRWRVHRVCAWSGG
jgi:hypothetical protein